MLESERQNAILTDIKNSVSASVTKLARKYNVSPNTIRRDMARLEKNGLIRRIHGGAVLNDIGGYDLPFEQRKIELIHEKEAIGAAAASLVANGDSIIIDAGTTCLMVAKHLKHLRNLTVLTNSIAVATELSNNPGILVFLCGGMLRRETLSLVGPPAEDFFNTIHVNKLFLATGGIAVDKGVITNPNIHEIPIKKKMMEAAQEIIVVADNGKFNKLSLQPFAEIREIDIFITDKISPEIKEKIELYGSKVILA